MGIRGPKSTGLTILPAPKNKRKSPMPGMTKPARVIWIRIMGSYPADHFKPQHYGMLRAYCEAEAIANDAFVQIGKVGKLVKNSTGGVKQNPYLQIYQNASSVMAQLGTKLGITYNATTVARGDTGHNSKPKSKREGLLFRGDL